MTITTKICSHGGHKDSGGGGGAGSGDDIGASAMSSRGITKQPQLQPQPQQLQKQQQPQHQQQQQQQQPRRSHRLRQPQRFVRLALCTLVLCDVLVLVGLQLLLLQVKPVDGQSYGSSRRCGKIKAPANGSLRFVYRNGKRVARFSCNSGYRLHGAALLACNGRKWLDQPPICYATTCDPLEVRPNVMFDVTPGGLLQALRCFPGYTFFGSPTIFCDGHQWNATSPFCRARFYDLPHSCTFENDDCRWGSDPEDTMHWMRHHGQTPTIGTGPQKDHTAHDQDGSYLYIETSNIGHDRTARLYSPVLQGDPGLPLAEGATAEDLHRCFGFWYHMYGSSIGNLSVRLRFDKQPLEESIEVHRVEGPQGDKWHNFQMTLPNTKTDYQIIIEGDAGPGYHGDMAIDDLYLQPKCVWPGSVDIEHKLPADLLLHPHGRIIIAEDDISGNRAPNLTNETDISEGYKPQLPNTTTLPPPKTTTPPQPSTTTPPSKSTTTPPSKSTTTPPSKSTTTPPPPPSTTTPPPPSTTTPPPPSTTTTPPPPSTTTTPPPPSTTTPPPPSTTTLLPPSTTTLPPPSRVVAFRALLPPSTTTPPPPPPTTTPPPPTTTPPPPCTSTPRPSRTPTYTTTAAARTETITAKATISTPITTTTAAIATAPKRTPNLDAESSNSLQNATSPRHLVERRLSHEQAAMATTATMTTDSADSGSNEDSYVDIIEDALYPLFGSRGEDTNSTPSSESSSKGVLTSTATTTTATTTTTITTTTTTPIVIGTSAWSGVRRPNTPETPSPPRMTDDQPPETSTVARDGGSRFPLLSSFSPLAFRVTVSLTAALLLVATLLLGIVCALKIRRNRGQSFRILADSEINLVMDFISPRPSPEGMVERIEPELAVESQDGDTCPLVSTMRAKLLPPAAV